MVVAIAALDVFVDAVQIEAVRLEQLRLSSAIALQGNKLINDCGRMPFITE